MVREELLALADRVEALSGPCRETDRAIFHAMTDGCYWPEFYKFWEYSDTGLSRVPINFTASIDAAMTLVPEGCVVMVTNSGMDNPRQPDFSKATAICGQFDDTAMKPVEASTPALALTAAALRAIAEATA